MSNTVSAFSEHFDALGPHYHSANNSDSDRRLIAVRCALELVASYGSNEKCYLSVEVGNLSDYADKIQAALEVKNKE